MTDDDYTNPRWHVDGLTVTHEDMPGMKWNLALKDNAEGHASQPPNSSWTHAARAWLAAQPKPVPEVGMRIEATLRGGAVVTGVVDSVSQLATCSVVVLGGARFFLETDPESVYQLDILSWHEVTS